MGSHWWQMGIGFCDGLTPNRRQVIIKNIYDTFLITYLRRSSRRVKYLTINFIFIAYFINQYIWHEID